MQEVHLEDYITYINKPYSYKIINIEKRFSPLNIPLSFHKWHENLIWSCKTIIIILRNDSMLTKPVFNGM